jgi:glycosyltransferase involved in cell wall biosynthesis
MRVPPPGSTILQITPGLDAGGVEQTTLDVASALVAAGCRSIVASSGGRLEDELAARGGVLARMPVQSKNPFTLLANAERLRGLIQRERVDVIHVRSRAPAFSALAAASRTGVPLVATYHGLYSARSPLKRWYNAVMTRGDLVIANSDFTREHVIAEHGADPAKVISIPRGVDLARFDPAAVSPERVRAVREAWGVRPDETRPVLLLAGRLTRWKGQGLMIQALAALKVEGVEALLVLAGDDQGRSDYTAELEGLARSLGVSESVRFVGHLADMPAAYLASDIALAPSFPKPEAFGRTAVEPQAMGRPVLASDHGAVVETVVDGETGWRVTPGDLAAWVEALKTTLALSADERAVMGAAGMARARDLYSLERMSALTLDVYARLIEARRR